MAGPMTFAAGPWHAGPRPQARPGAPVHGQAGCAGWTISLSRVGARVARGGDLGDAQAELLVDDDDLAAGDRLCAYQQVDGLVGQAVEGDDGARAERERLAEGHAGAAD